MNTHLLTGTVDGDVQTFKVGEKSKVSFRLAESGGKGWHTIVIWESDTTIPKKGDLVFIEGRVGTRSYEQDGVKKYVSETTARVVEVLNTTAQTAADTELAFDD
jgi:single-stranded DNA-binding protein